MKHEQALMIAQYVRELLTPHCEKCEIAGSVRRKKAEVKDIEIVCIPNKEDVGLFGTDTETCFEFVSSVKSLGKIEKGSPYGKYCQIKLKTEINLDLFIAIPENWGLIMAIRTGPAEFSKSLMKRAHDVNLRVKEGKVWYAESIGTALNSIKCCDEKDLFDMLGLNWADPESRGESCRELIKVV